MSSASQPMVDDPATASDEFQALLARVGPKDRLNLERHMALCDGEADPNHGRIWRRLVVALAGLAPHATRTVGRQTVQFFIPDGKYRQQVFALHDLTDGALAVYVGNVDKESDVLQAAVKGKVVSPAQGNVYRIVDSKEGLEIDELDAKSASPQPFYKDMLGWNRKALRITIRTTATEEQVAAVVKICALAAKKWKPA